MIDTILDKVFEIKNKHRMQVATRVVKDAIDFSGLNGLVITPKSGKYIDIYDPNADMANNTIEGNRAKYMIAGALRKKFGDSVKMTQISTCGKLWEVTIE